MAMTSANDRALVEGGPGASNNEGEASEKPFPLVLTVSAPLPATLFAVSASLALIPRPYELLGMELAAAVGSSASISSRGATV